MFCQTISKPLKVEYVLSPQLICLIGFVSEVCSNADPIDPNPIDCFECASGLSNESLGEWLGRVGRSIEALSEVILQLSWLNNWIIE